MFFIRNIHKLADALAEIPYEILWRSGYDYVGRTPKYELAGNNANVRCVFLYFIVRQSERVSIVDRQKAVDRRSTSLLRIERCPQRVVARVWLSVTRFTYRNQRPLLLLPQKKSKTIAKMRERRTRRDSRESGGRETRLDSIEEGRTGWSIILAVC